MNQPITELDGTIVIIKPEVTPSRQRKLDALELYLKAEGMGNHNPVDFIRSCYSGNPEQGVNKMSIGQLRDFLFHKGVNYKTDEGLRQLLVAIGIERRDKSVKTLKGGLNSGQNSHNREISHQNTESVRKLLLEILETDTIAPPLNFDIGEYNSIHFPIDKALYLLSITPENIKSIRMASQIGKGGLSSSINNLLCEIQEILSENGIQIDVPSLKPGSVSNLLRKLN